MASYRSLLRADSESSRSLNSESTGRFSRLFSNPSSPASSAATSTDDESDITQLGDLLVRKDPLLERSHGAGSQSVQSFIDRELVNSEHTASISYLIELCYAGYDKSRLSPSLVISTPDKKPAGKELIYNHLSKENELKKSLKYHGLKLYVVFDDISQAGGPGTTAPNDTDAYLTLVSGANSLVGAQAVFPNVSQLGSTTSTCGVTWDVGGEDCLTTSLHAWESARSGIKEQAKVSVGSLHDDEEECNDDGHALSMFSDDSDDDDDGSSSDSDNRISVTSDLSHGPFDLHGDHHRPSHACNNRFDSPVSWTKETAAYQPSQRLTGIVRPIHSCPNTDIVLLKAREAAPTMKLSDLVRNTHNGRKITKIHHDDPLANFPVTIATHRGDIRGVMEPGKVLYRNGSRVHDMRAVRTEFSLGKGISGANVFCGNKLVGTVQVIRGNGTWCYLIPIEAQVAEMEEVCGVPVRLAGSLDLSDNMVGHSEQGPIKSLPETQTSSRSSSWSSAGSSDDGPETCEGGQDCHTAEEVTRTVSSITPYRYNFNPALSDHDRNLPLLVWNTSLSTLADLVRPCWDDYPLTSTLTVPCAVRLFGSIEIACGYMKLSFLLVTIGVGMLAANRDAEPTAESTDTFTSILQSVGRIILGAIIPPPEDPEGSLYNISIFGLAVKGALEDRRKPLHLRQLHPHPIHPWQLSARIAIDRGDINSLQALSAHLDTLYAKLEFILRTLSLSIPMILGDPVSFWMSLMFAASARRTGRPSLYLLTRSREFLIRTSRQDSHDPCSFCAADIEDSQDRNNIDRPTPSFSCPYMKMTGECKYQDSIFSNKSSLLRHSVAAHQVRSSDEAFYQCPIYDCVSAYRRLGDFKFHFHQKHPEDSTDKELHDRQSSDPHQYLELSWAACATSAAPAFFTPLYAAALGENASLVDLLLQSNHEYIRSEATTWYCRKWVHTSLRNGSLPPTDTELDRFYQTCDHGDHRPADGEEELPDNLMHLLHSPVAATSLIWNCCYCEQTNWGPDGVEETVQLPVRDQGVDLDGDEDLSPLLSYIEMFDILNDSLQWRKELKESCFWRSLYISLFARCEESCGRLRGYEASRLKDGSSRDDAIFAWLENVENSQDVEDDESSSAGI